MQKTQMRLDFNSKKERTNPHVGLTTGVIEVKEPDDHKSDEAMSALTSTIVSDFHALFSRHLESILGLHEIAHIWEDAKPGYLIKEISNPLSSPKRIGGLGRKITSFCFTCAGNQKSQALYSGQSAAESPSEPRKEWKTKSAKARGISIHQFIHHTITCHGKQLKTKVEREYVYKSAPLLLDHSLSHQPENIVCLCKEGMDVELWNLEEERVGKSIIRYLREELFLHPVISEVAIYWPEENTGTKIDLLCFDQTYSLVLVSIKTGVYGSREYPGNSGQMMKGEWKNEEDTIAKRHDLQVAAEHFILKHVYHLEVVRSLIVYSLTEGITLEHRDVSIAFCIEFAEKYRRTTFFLRNFGKSCVLKSKHSIIKMSADDFDYDIELELELQSTNSECKNEEEEIETGGEGVIWGTSSLFTFDKVVRRTRRSIVTEPGDDRYLLHLFFVIMAGEISSKSVIETYGELDKSNSSQNSVSESHLDFNAISKMKESTKVAQLKLYATTMMILSLFRRFYSSTTKFHKRMTTTSPNAGNQKRKQTDFTSNSSVEKKLRRSDET